MAKSTTLAVAAVPRPKVVLADAASASSIRVNPKAETAEASSLSASASNTAFCEGAIFVTPSTIAS